MPQTKLEETKVGNNATLSEGSRLTIRNLCLQSADLIAKDPNPYNSESLFRFRTVMNQMPEAEVTHERDDAWWGNAWNSFLDYTIEKSEKEKINAKPRSETPLTSIENTHSPELLQTVKDEIRQKVREMDPDGFGLQKALNNKGTKEQRDDLNNLLLEHYAISDQQSMLAKQLEAGNLDHTTRVLLNDIIHFLGDPDADIYARGMVSMMAAQYVKAINILSSVSGTKGTEKPLFLASQMTTAILNMMALNIYPEIEALSEQQKETQ